MAQAHGGHIANKIVKEPRVFIQNVPREYFGGTFQSDQHVITGHIVIKVGGTFQKSPACTPWVMCGHIAQESSMYPQCAPWVSTPLPPVGGASSSEESSLGKTSSRHMITSSVITGTAGAQLHSAGSLSTSDVTRDPLASRSVSMTSSASTSGTAELPTILRNVDLERIVRGEGCQVTGCVVGKGKG